MTEIKYTLANKELELQIKPDEARFPLCITWTHLPLLTLMVPSIGHTGICTTEGIIHDFAGPYYISVDDFAFGSTIKYLQLDISPSEFKRYNDSIEGADKVYCKRNHNICCDNCHSHVAKVLNIFKYKGKSNYTMVDVWWMLIWKSKYVSWFAVIYTYMFYIIFGAIYMYFYLI